MTHSFGELEGLNPEFVAVRARLLDASPPRVRLVLGKLGAPGDPRPWEALRAHALGKLARYWPGPPHPELYVPSARGGEVVVVHAKLVLRDQREVLLTSPNLNSSGLSDNVEVGVQLGDPVPGRHIQMGVEQLVDRGWLVRGTASTTP